MTVLTVVLLLAAALAWWGARRARSASEYFAAGQRARAWLVGVAGTAAAVSGFTFIGGPGLFAALGIGSLWIILSAPVTGALQCWVVGEPVVEAVRQRGALTLPELLGHRFGSRHVRIVAAVLVALGCVAALAVQVRAACVLGEDFLHLPGALAGTFVMVAICAYTAMGGMRSGLLADAVLGSVMALAGLLLAAAALAAAGGPAHAVATLARASPHLLGSFGAAPPGQALSWYLLFCLGTCAQPHYIQKFFFLRGRAELRRLPAVLTAALAAMLAVWIGVGIGGAALVARGSITLARADDLAPRVMDYLGPWAVLLAGVAVLAAMMSTATSFLNLAAAAVTRDVPQALGRTAGGIAAARLATVLIAVPATLIGVGSGRAVALLGVAGWGFFTAALLPAMTLGLAWHGATGRSVAVAMAFGALVDLALEAVRASLPPALEPGLAGAAAGMVALVALSLAHGCARVPEAAPSR